MYFRLATQLSIFLVIGFATLLLGGCDASVEEVEETAEPVAVEIQPDLSDPYRWLEEVEGEQALAWAAEQNVLSVERLQGDPRFEPIHQEIESKLTSDNRIPAPSLVRGVVYNFWQDASHVRGLLRRTTSASYRSEQPEWETILDMDALAEAEGENWVYKGRTCLPSNPSRCLLHLSDGGKDAVVIREFDLDKKSFVEGGFFVAEGKTSIDWLDEDTLIVGTNFGNDSLTTSGYARTLRLWQRGSDLASAPQVIEVQSEDMGVYFNSVQEGESSVNIVTRRPDFFTEQNWLLTGEGELAEIPLPADADVLGVFAGQLLAMMRSDWTPDYQQTYPAGSLIAMDIEASVTAGAASGISLLLDPDSDATLDAIQSIGITSNSIYVGALKDVSGRLLRIRLNEASWSTVPVSLPEDGAIQIVSADDYSDTLIARYQSFLTPQTLYLIEEDSQPEVIKRQQPQFDAEPFTVKQSFAVSADGTRIPYYVVHAKDIPLDGSTPTRLTAYGGFEISRTPVYMDAAGQSWLERGGAYVLANIRGGGEYGPGWHQTALQENRYRVFEDFIAVAEDLIENGITSPGRLGISGGSNGGLLVTAVMVQRPELFNAVISAVPLIDMLRYHQLLAGASWMAEYGNPDIEEHFEFISRYSPYQNVLPGVDYPELFLWTNPKDDRVHPGHARKMAARMMEQGHELIYFENTEGGHGGGANLNQLARTQAMEIVYLMQQLAD